MNARLYLPRADKGFTLIELLVAMAIFGVISALALGGLNAIITQQTLAKENMLRLAELQRTVRLVTNDFRQLFPRFVRDELGQSAEPPLVTGLTGDFVVRISRGGWRNPARFNPETTFSRGTLQRVQYRLEDDVLLREYWPVMDHTLGMEPRSESLIDGVNEIKIEYLDLESAWHEQWPPLQALAATSFPYPRAVRITFDIAGWGEIERLVDLAL